MLATRNLGNAGDLLALQRLAPARYPLLLESSAAGTAQGRWDILLAASGESIALDAGGILHREDGSSAARAVRAARGTALAVPRRLGAAAGL